MELKMEPQKSSELMSAIIGYKPLVINSLHQNKIIREFELSNGEERVVSETVPIGIEVEVERCNLEEMIDGDHPFHTFWRVIEDNSLRNNGREFVSYPITGNRIPVALTLLRDVLKAHYPQHEFTSRTSVHIHVNCRHLTQEQFCSLILLYLVLEPVFYYFADKTKEKRSQNNFCVPVEFSKFTLKLPQIIEALKTNNGKNAVKLINNHWRKYSGFNLLPMKTQGTVEFRHLTGTIDVPFLMRWINMILRLRKYALDNPIDSVLKSIFELNTISSYRGFVTAVLGDIDIPDNFLRIELEKSSTSIKTVTSYMNLRESMLSVGTTFQESSLFEKLKVNNEVVNVKEVKENIRKWEAELNKLTDEAMKLNPKEKDYAEAVAKYTKAKGAYDTKLHSAYNILERIWG